MKKHYFTQEIVDKISDDLKSTFHMSSSSSTSIYDCFYESDVPVVAAAVDKYIPGALVKFIRLRPVVDDYCFWEVSIG